MSFIRPELATRLHQWREPLLWGGLIAAGAWMLWHGLARDAFVPLLIGGSVALTGALMLKGSVARARLAAFPLGAGVVIVDEGRIVLFGPEQGGAMDLAAIARIDVVSGLTPLWRLGAGDGSSLDIPMAAKGADHLADALGALPGFDMSKALAGRRQMSRTVWRSGALGVCANGSNLTLRQ